MTEKNHVNSIIMFFLVIKKSENEKMTEVLRYFGQTIEISQRKEKPSLSRVIFEARTCMLLYVNVDEDQILL